MGVLDAFSSTWSSARQTFGDGAPQAGTQFDASGKLQKLQTNVESAAPDSRWSGTASTGYGTATKDHGRVFGQLAGLDRRLAAEVDNSATVVASGRRDLDAIRKWVMDMAATVPQNQPDERMLLPVVEKGLKDIAEIVERSNGDMSTIGERIRGIGNEYDALGNQKFGKPPEDGPGDDIRTAQQRLDDDKNLIGDSLQMMSSEQFDYAKVPLEVGAPDCLTETARGGSGRPTP